MADALVTVDALLQHTGSVYVVQSFLSYLLQYSQIDKGGSREPVSSNRLWESQHIGFGDRSEG